MNTLQGKHMSKTKKKADPKYIIERKTFIDDRGRIVIGQTLVSGEPPEDFASFLGHGTIEAEVKTKMGPMKANNQVTFGLDVETVEEAYAILEQRFVEVQAGEVERMRADVVEKIKQHESQQSPIILPGHTNGPHPRAPLLPPGMGRGF